MKEKSRTFLAIRNAIFNFIYQLINTITNIILPPLIISTFGSIINGLISTIRQIINYVQIVGSGISESTIVSLYKPLNDKDEKKISSIYNASAKTFNKSGIFFTILAIIIAFIYPLLLKEDLEYLFVVKIVIILSISGASEFFAIGKYRTLLTADQKIYIVNIAQILGIISSTILSVILIKSNCSIILVQLVSAFFYVSRIGLLYYYVHKNYKYLDKSIEPDYNAVSKRKAAMVHQIASLVIFGSQTLFIANFCGLAEASVYSVYNLIFTGINTILSTISSAMIAGMGNLMTNSNEEKVRNVYNVYEYGYYILLFTFYITTFVMCIPFIKLYTSGVTDANYIRFELVILFSIMGLLNCLRTPGGTMINAKGHYNETKNRAIIEMSICLFGEILLVKKYGIVGVLIATILAYLYRTIDVIIYNNKKIINRSVKYSVKKIIINIVIFCVFIVLNDLFGNTLNINGYMSWIMYAFIIVLLSGISILGANYIFDRDSFKNLIVYVKEIVRRKK